MFVPAYNNIWISIMQYGRGQLSVKYVQILVSNLSVSKKSKLSKLGSIHESFLIIVYSHFEL